MTTQVRPQRVAATNPSAFAKSTARLVMRSAGFCPPDQGWAETLGMTITLPEPNNSANDRSDNSGTDTDRRDNGNSHGTDMDSRSRGAHQC